MILNGIIPSASDNTFEPDAPLTKAALSAALVKITGNGDAVTDTDNVSKLHFAISVFKAAPKTNISEFFNAFKFAFNVILSGNNVISRSAASELLYSFIHTFY